MHTNLIQIQMCAQILLKHFNFLKKKKKNHDFLITIKIFEKYINKPINKYREVNMLILSCGCVVLVHFVVLFFVLIIPVSEFLVVVQKTDAATRCDLQGAYWLQVGQEALLLKETQKKSVVREWPYEMLRRYGKDKVNNSH